MISNILKLFILEQNSRNKDSQLARDQPWIMNLQDWMLWQMQQYLEMMQVNLGGHQSLPPQNIPGIDLGVLALSVSSHQAERENTNLLARAMCA